MSTPDEPIVPALAGEEPSLLGALPPRQRRRFIARIIAHVLTVTGLLLLVYFEAPMGADSEASTVALLVLGLVGFTAVLVVQIRRIVASPIPQLRAVEALGTAIPLFVVVFALVYLSMAEANPATFSEPLSRMGSLYFTVTVLSTVGFGDITPVTDAARAVVTIQMVLDLIIIGVVVKLIVGATRVGVQRRRREAQQATRGDPDA